MINIDDLPEHLLFHVLSFLDAKSLIRTGVLCKRWRTLWKDTPDLNLYLSDQPSLIKTHVEKLLLSLSSDQKKSLRNLRLVRSWFDGPSGFSGFTSLTTLELTDCSFDGEKKWYNIGSPTILLPLADLPSLKHLKLLGCSAVDGVIVSVPHLLDLEIRTRHIFGFRVEQLLAPKLESFTYASHVRTLADPSEVEVCYGLPSLDLASIRIVWKELCDVEMMERQDCMIMAFFRGMRNVTSLDLCFDKQHENEKGPWENLDVLLNKIKSLLVSRDSQFTALKTLRIRHPHELARDGYQVIHYRFEGRGLP